MLDWLLIGIFSTFLIVCFVIAYRWQAHVDSAVANIAGAVIFTLFAGYPVLVALGALEKFVRRHWITSYYTEESDGVLKVFGAVPLRDWEFVRSRLLAIRPNYRLVDDAYERFGCTMAAVPASEAYLNARRELARHEFSI